MVAGGRPVVVSAAAAVVVADAAVVVAAAAAASASPAVYEADVPMPVAASERAPIPLYGRRTLHYDGRT